MKLVERHIVKDNRFEDICLKSGLLYNYVLFNVRQGIFDGNYLKEYEFSTKLCKENQYDFRNRKLVGISFQTNEESYTSKVDHLAFEKLCKHDVYLGKRKKRGLFQSSIGKLINADINGAIGIGRKVFGDSYISGIIDSGLAFNPVRVNIL